MNDLLTHSIRRSIWWGWGDPAEAHPLSDSAWQTLEENLGIERLENPISPVKLRDVKLPESRLSEALATDFSSIVGPEQVGTTHEDRIEHAAGKSYPDIYRARHGHPLSAPDAVIYPQTGAEVAQILAYCHEHQIQVVPFGGGTSVVGGVTINDPSPLTVSIDLRNLNRLMSFDPLSRIATMQAGLRGPEIEKALHPHGMTLGHYPQSHQEATLGGYLATRSAGQASTGYGRPDERVIGLKMATPTGWLEIGGHTPASAAGPRLIDLAVGSEGALGIITEATLRVTPLPNQKIHQAWAFPNLSAGTDALRHCAQELGDGWMPDVCRLSDEEETWVNLTLAGSSGSAISRYLQMRKLTNPSLLIAVWEGDSPRSLKMKAKAAATLFTEAGGVRLPSAVATAWEKGRFSGPYLRDELMGHRIMAETLETATTWSNLPRLHEAVRKALRDTLEADGRRCIVMGHLSHIYASGSSLYYTFIAPESEDAVSGWREVKSAACAAIMANGGTISHHHAVGSDHLPYLTTEIGQVGTRLLQAVKREVDPKNIMNPGKLVP